MDGNHSLLDVVSHLIQCEDVQPPLIISIVLGFPANMCVMWLILTGPGDILSLNQAMCEVVICMASVVALIAINATWSSVATVTFLRHSIRFSWTFLLTGRPLFMSCVCLERYLAVIHPMTFLKYKPLRYRRAGVIISWMMVLACGFIFVWVPDPGIYYVCFGMAFPWFLVQLFCCITTLCALVRPGPGEGNQRSRGMDSAKLKAFKIILAIMVDTAFCYIFYITSIILLGHASREDSTKMFCFTAFSTFIAGFIPPLLYIYRAGKLSHCIKDTV